MEETKVYEIEPEFKVRVNSIKQMISAIERGIKQYGYNKEQNAKFFRDYDFIKQVCKEKNTLEDIAENIDRNQIALCEDLLKEISEKFLSFEGYKSPFYENILGRMGDPNSQEEASENIAYAYAYAYLGNIDGIKKDINTLPEDALFDDYFMMKFLEGVALDWNKVKKAEQVGYGELYGACMKVMMAKVEQGELKSVESERNAHPKSDRKSSYDECEL